MNAKWLILLMVLMLLSCANSAFTQGTAFTYQGRLQNNGNPVNNICKFTFSLFKTNVSGIPVTEPVTNEAVSVSNGLFTTLVDFGSNAFGGTTNWLEIGVETNGADTFTILAPRQPLTPVPLAISAMTAGTAGNLAGPLPLTQLPTVALTNGESGVTITGSFNGDGSGLTNLPYASLVGSLPVTSTLQSGSSFTMVSNAFAKGGTIWFQPGDYYNMSNIVPVNNTCLIGLGATLHFASTCTGIFIDCSTNVSNFSAKGIRLTGDAFANYASSSFIAPYPGTAGLFTPWYIGQTPGTYTNRSGLRINGAAGGLIEDVTVDGFGGYGFIFVSTNPEPQGSKTMFIGNIAVSNYCGCGFWAFVLDWATPGSTFGGVIGGNDENQCLTGCHFQANGIGLYAGVANLNVTGCNISGNWVGLYVGPATSNFGHGCVTGNTINHNQYATVVTANDENIIGNTMLDNGNILFDCPVYAVFANNHISGSGLPVVITATNSENGIMGQVSICNNWYLGDFASAIVTNFNVGPGKTGHVLWYNNQTSGGSALDSDGTPASLINQSGNPAGLTNTFNGSVLPDIAISATGVTNTARVYGTVQLSVTSGSFTNFNAAGIPVLTNIDVTGVFTYALGPGASITGPGGLSGFIIFQ